MDNYRCSHHGIVLFGGAIWNSSVLQNKLKAGMSDEQALGVFGTTTRFLNGERIEGETSQGFIDQVGAAMDPRAEMIFQTESSEESVVGEESGEAV